MKALITAGGRATRLRPITHTLNKHLIPLVNKPMLAYALEKVRECGITEVAINVNSGEREIQEEFGDGSSFGLRITYIEQKGGPKGLAHIIRNASDWLGRDPFVFYLGDNIILGSIKPLIDRFIQDDLDCLLALSRVSDPQRFGVPVIQNGKITRVVEKPEQPPSDFAVTGIYVYKPIILNAVQDLQLSPRGEYEISDAHTWLINRGYRVGYEEITGWWKDTGKPEDLIEGNRLLLQQMQRSIIAPDAVIESGAKIEGIVSIGSGTIIGSDATLIGPLSIGSRTEIRDSIMGPNVSIGDECVIKSMRIECSLIMNRAQLIGGPFMSQSIVGRDVQALPPMEKNIDRTFRFFMGDRTEITWENLD